MSRWWRGTVIYQVYPRSFLDTTGNGIGDLKGITQKLKYIADLGVDGVWISPFFKSPMKDFGYDVSDYRDVDPLFGTLSDFDELLVFVCAIEVLIRIKNENIPKKIGFCIGLFNFNNSIPPLFCLEVIDLFMVNWFNYFLHF